MKPRVLFLCYVALYSRDCVDGNGKLKDPPSRSSMWRYGYDTPINYDDNTLNCGGFTHQEENGFKCGVCGDPYDGQRQNEAGGKYATGIIVKEYEIGSVIPIQVEITANQKGWFEFKICANNNVESAVTQECLDRYPLPLADGTGTKYDLPNEGSGIYKVRVQLPPNLNCSQCVLQWRYHTGNRWGVDADTGREGVGYGPQEEFYGCADIAVRYFGTNSSKYSSDESKSEQFSTTAPTTTTQPAQEQLGTRSTSDQTISPSKSDIVCKAIPPYDKQPGMNDWCNLNCPMACPESHCQCK